MKTLTLTLTLTLLLTASIRAQDAPVPVPRPTASAGSKPAPTLRAAAPAAPVNTAENLHLAGGLLPDVVLALEDRMGNEFSDSSGARGTMPNVLFGAGTMELKMTADLRLRDVTPVQALTLVAVAAGCTLEPIAALRDGSENEDELLAKGARIIGYQFVLRPSSTRYQNIDAYQNTQVTSATSPGGVMSALSVPGFAPAAIPTVPASPPKEGSPSAGSGKGSFDSFTPGGQRKNEPQAVAAAVADSSQDNFAIFGSVSTPATAHSPLYGVINIPVAAETPTVRIYALGAVVSGGPSAEKEKQRTLETLVAVALDQAKLGAEDPVLSFHEASKALIVKGTTAQHDIIAQILAAMKENQEAETALR